MQEKDLLVLKCPDGTLFGLNWASYTWHITVVLLRPCMHYNPDVGWESLAFSHHSFQRRSGPVKFFYSKFIQQSHNTPCFHHVQTGFLKLKHLDFASLELKRRLSGSSPQHFPPKFNWHSGERQVMLSWHFKNSDLSIKLSGREAWVVTPQDKFPRLQSPAETCFTPLHSKLVSLLGDVRLEGSYSDIKSHATPGSQFLCWC